MCINKFIKFYKDDWKFLMKMKWIDIVLYDIKKLKMIYINKYFEKNGIVK